MIFDHISQRHTYQGVSPDIRIGLEYLASLRPDIALGDYQVSPNVLALVTEYATKTENLHLFEAHRHVVDIQFPIVGLEGIEWSRLDGMQEAVAYDESKDRTMYKAPQNLTNIVIGGGFFAIFWPADAHNPQRAAHGKSETIKKVTLKVSIR